MLTDRDPGDSLFVPPVDTWLPETVHVIAKALSTLIPGGEDPAHAAWFVYLAETKIDSVVHINVENRRYGAGLLVSGRTLSDPMRAWIATVPPVGSSGSPVAAIDARGTVVRLKSATK
jgi:hypothetical protein